MHALLLGALLLPSSISCGPRGRTTKPNDYLHLSPPQEQPKIDASWVREFVTAFSTDELQGRFTLDAPALDRAATMIASEYRALGLSFDGSDYRMPYDFTWGTELTGAYHLWIERDGVARELDTDAFATLSPPFDGAAVGDPIYLSAKLLRGKPAGLAVAKGRIAVIVDPLAAGATVPPDNSDLTQVTAALATAGALGVLVVGDRTETIKGGTWPIPVLAVRAAALPKLSDTIAGAVSSRAAGSVLGQNARVSLAARRADVPRSAYNVLAWIPGTRAKEEVVLLGAHFDHIGTEKTGLHCRPVESDTTCNGADDNASGTALVLAIAKALHHAGIRPARTIAFAHFSGEEMGLYGSKAMAELPRIAGGKVVAMVNFDMVGRLGNDGLWVGGVGSAPQWMDLLTAANGPAIPTVYEGSVTARSDHASFYSKDIPVLFFFTGLHDDYHRVGDEADGLNIDGMVEIGEVALQLIRRLGDGAAIAFSPPAEGGGLVTRLPGSDPSSVVKPASPQAPATGPAASTPPASAPPATGGAKGGAKP